MFGGIFRLGQILLTLQKIDQLLIVVYSNISAGDLPQKIHVFYIKKAVFLNFGLAPILKDSQTSED